MPDLLREQFPHFRPIVEAFGYRNLEFEGWEADDVIATLATRADEAGIKTCVVSTDRDAFQLVTENVCLMMTPRGVADVNVYTPERVEARYGIRPDQVPDFIGLKGDTSDNIPGVPGIGDKTAGAADRAVRLARGGARARRRALAGARARTSREHADQARDSKELATMRRDLDIDCDPAELVLAPPDRSQLKEMFRRFEFRGLLQRDRPARRGAPGAAPTRGRGRRRSPWREGEHRRARRPASGSRRTATAPPSRTTTGSSSGRRPDARRRRRSSRTTRRRCASTAADDTLLAAYLIEPGRADVRARRPRRPSTASSSCPTPEADEETAALVAPRGDAAPARRR